MSPSISTERASASAESDPRSSHLADALERRQPDIEARWLTKIRADARADHVQVTELKDGIGEYLRRIARALRSGASALECQASTDWADVADEHALTRIRIGFDVEQLVHELVVLRVTITDALREEGVIPNESSIERLTGIIDVALAASVKSYVQSRDYQLRRQQAEHLGFLAHQVRSPLFAAALSLAQARRRLTDSDDCALAIDRAQRNLERINVLIDDVLMVESLDAGAQRTQPADLTLGELLDDAVAAARQSAAQKGLTFRASYDPGLTVHTDRKLVVSALEHLIENGIKYTDRGEVTLDVRQANGQLEFHVRDTCPGLSDEELNIIFEPFQRGRSGKTGTGLGLAIVRRAVRALGGQIHVESPEDRGCHFWFSLPNARH